MWNNLDLYIEHGIILTSITNQETTMINNIDIFIPFLGVFTGAICVWIGIGISKLMKRRKGKKEIELIHESIADLKRDGFQLHKKLTKHVCQVERLNESFHLKEEKKISTHKSIAALRKAFNAQQHTVLEISATLKKLKEKITKLEVILVIEKGE